MQLGECPLETQKFEDDEPSTPGLEGLPDIHSRLGTHQSVGFVSKYTEGMQTMMGGQAPVDMDRFKAWHMNPCYHAVSHVSGLLVGPASSHQAEMLRRIPQTCREDARLRVVGLGVLEREARLFLYIHVFKTSAIEKQNKLCY